MNNLLISIENIVFLHFNKVSLISPVTIQSHS